MSTDADEEERRRQTHNVGLPRGLPAELLDHILQDIVREDDQDNRDSGVGRVDRAFPFSLCCRLFYGVALRTTYRRVAVIVNDEVSGNEAHRKLRYILHTPRLHRFVSSLYIEFKSPPLDPIPPEDLLKTAAGLIRCCHRLAEVAMVGEHDTELLSLPTSVVAALGACSSLQRLRFQNVTMFARWPARFERQNGPYLLELDGMAHLQKLDRLLKQMTPAALALRLRSFDAPFTTQPLVDDLTSLELRFHHLAELEPAKQTMIHAFSSLRMLSITYDPEGRWYHSYDLRTMGSRSVQKLTFWSFEAKFPGAGLLLDPSKWKALKKIHIEIETLLLTGKAAALVEFVRKLLRSMPGSARVAFVLPKIPSLPAEEEQNVRASLEPLRANLAEGQLVKLYLKDWPRIVLRKPKESAPLMNGLAR